MDTGSEERIRTRAHQIWERQGRPEGQEEEHWAQAEREIDNEDAAAAGAAETPRAAADGDPVRRPAEDKGAADPARK